mmetsp:Transcript_36430/g.66738  ORF Transcript_36430/g.66738 Transcript_36430/m.66738 type:complete len:338 (-) Transcript_36430:12-1025(-)
MAAGAALLLARLVLIASAGMTPSVTCTLDSCRESGGRPLQLIHGQQHQEPLPADLDQLLQQPPLQHLQAGGLGVSGQQAAAAGASSNTGKASPSSYCAPLGLGPGLACLDTATGKWNKVRWFSEWAYKMETLKTVHDALKHGKLVRIADALTPQAAEALYQEIWNSNGSPGWKVDIQNRQDIQFHRHVFSCQAGGEPACPPLLHAFHTFLESEKDFWGKLVRSNISSWRKTAHATWYKGNDFLSPHSDYTHQRDLAFNLALSKNWNQSWGGAFWWLKDSAQEYPASFNTLFLFLPSTQSTHMVSTVSKEGDTHRRFSINGWFVGHDAPFGLLGDAAS